MQTRTFSAESWLPSSIKTPTRPPWSATLFIFLPRRSFIPLLFKITSNCMVIRASILERVPRSLGRISIILTSHPISEKKPANSQPITPPPTMMRSLGTSSISRASFEVNTFLPSTGKRGIFAGSEPVATITLEASTSPSFFSFRLISTILELKSLPLPSISSIPLFCKRCLIP